jgi:hypothetical protein
MIVDVKDASFRVFHGLQLVDLAYQHQPVCAIISRTSEVALSVP